MNKMSHILFLKSNKIFHRRKSLTRFLHRLNISLFHAKKVSVRSDKKKYTYF